MEAYKNQTIILRLAEKIDAEFILKLRLDPRYNQHLSVVDSSLQKQIDWLEKYKLEEKNKTQFYFIIERLDGVRCGTVRVYDLKSNSFCWGSWILNEEKTRTSAFESALQVYNFGFKILGFEKSHFEVRKDNAPVNRFHQKMGAIKTGEDINNNYYSIDEISVDNFFDTFRGKLL